MNIDELGLLRYSRCYSLDMMAAWLGCTMEQYLELEFGLRMPDAEENAVLARLFGQELEPGL